MELIEREELLDFLQTQLKNVEAEGHCVFIAGEAGIGKTSLVKVFCKQNYVDANIYHGACDALFTPRPLAPLYDIIWQLDSELGTNSHTIQERTELFSKLFFELSIKKEKTLIIFEDIHWADEATLDFIKFFARRISQLKCLFILTYRDDEIHSRHPLRNVLGQLPTDSFTKVSMNPLSREAVEKMAIEKGYSGQDVYSISGGNPFYVTEILSSYSVGVPDNIKDAILSTYNRLEETTRQIWDLLSVIPSGFEIKYLEMFEPLYSFSLESCLQAKILFLKDGNIFFKHELFRRTIETSLSPLKRIALNKKILTLLQESFEENQEIERIIHHAKNANEYDLVVRYTPLAASNAACIGAHIEASRLYFTAIEYYQGNDKEVLIKFYESYAYECYLINNIKQAIIYAGKTLNLLKEKNATDKIGNCMRFLSRLWWLDGNKNNAEKFAEQAIQVLSDQSSSPAKAMAFSNMSQLKMLCDQPAQCIEWGEKAISIAREINNEEALSHALNNVGSVYMNSEPENQKGVELLQQSLDIALKNSFHEHAARAYSNLASNGIEMKDYVFAKKILEQGIKYCEERELDSWRSNMLSLKAILNLETGDWKGAYTIADNLLKNEFQIPSFNINALTVLGLINLRTGDADALPLLIKAKTKAFESRELQRIIPSLVALLEYEWLTGKIVIEKTDLDYTLNMIDKSIYNVEKNRFAFWLCKARKQQLSTSRIYEGYEVSSVAKAQKAASIWEKSGCNYSRAMALFEGTTDDKRKAILIVHDLGANAVFERMKLEMRTSGIKSIPRGLRKTTQSNPAFLTGRELDVLHLLKDGLQNKEIASQLFISAKTVDHHISSILFKLDVNTRSKAVTEAIRMEIIK